jgi:hypothetical protein
MVPVYVRTYIDTTTIHFRKNKLNIAVESLALGRYIQEVAGSNSGHESNYPDSSVRGFTLSLQVNFGIVLHKKF